MDHGRIHRDIPDHPKFQKASLAAIGLWTLGNARTRQLRSAGRLPYDEAFTLARGEDRLIRELVDCDLWELDADHVVYHDYLAHNADLTGRAGAARMVADTLKGSYPGAVITSLANKVDELLNEGQDPHVLREAVKAWGDTKDAGVGLLPHLVANVIRRGGTGERTSALREAWKTGDLRPLAKFGLVFTPPDIPREITNVDDAKLFMLDAKRIWIERQ